MATTAQPFIAPEGAQQFVPHYKHCGVDVAVWLYASGPTYHCSMCHGQLRSVVRETLPAEWARGPAGCIPFLCINPQCKAGGRFIE